MRFIRHFQLASVFACCLGQTQVVEGQQSAYEEHARRLVLWLPDQTESLFVVKSASCKSVTGEGGIESALADIRAGKFRKRLSHQPIVLVAWASCRFRPPDIDRAAVQYDGCQLVLFEKDITSLTSELLKDMAVDADDSLTIAGRQVLRFKELLNERQEWMFFVACPSPRVLVVATDQQYLRDLIVRIDQPAQKSFVHDNRLEAELPLHADVWAVRQYKEPPLDPFVPRGAKGFVVSLEGPKTGKVTFMAEEGTPAESIRRMWKFWPPIDTLPSIAEVKPGVCEIRHVLNAEEPWDAFWLVVWWHLGHQAG